MPKIFENLRKALKSNPYQRSADSLDNKPPKKRKTEMKGLGGGPGLIRSHELQGGVSQEDDAYIRRAEEKARHKLKPKAYSQRY